MKPLLFIRSLLLIGFITGSMAAKAQNSETLTREDLNRFSTGKIVRTVTSTEYSGTPYLNTDWQQGYILINQKAKSQQIPLRYNAYENHVEYLENETIYIVPSNKLAGFVIYTTDGDMVFKNGYDPEGPDIEAQTLLRVIHNGNFKLLAHHKIVLRDGMQSYGSAVKKKEFVNSDNYYLVDQEGTFHKLKKLKEKDILKHMNNKRSELEKYAHKKKLSFSKESDVRLLLQFYDSLQ